MNSNHSDSELVRIRKTVDGWYQQFSTSPEFERLTRDERSEAGAVIEFVCDYSYSYFNVRPEQWDAGVVLKCCTDILPRKVSAERAFFTRIAPVLSAFCTFLERKELVRNAGEIAEAVTRAAEEIVENSQDQTAWGPAKQILMAAFSAGVDIRDEKQLDVFMTGLNMRAARRAG